jgi:integrase
VTKPLTDSQIKNLKPPAGRQIDVKDVRVAGLFLRVSSDAKTWSLRFSHPVTARRLRMTLGKYPDLGLKEARERASELRKQIAAGIDPIAARKVAREEAPKRSFAYLAGRYQQEYANRFLKPASAIAADRNLRLHLLPKWGDRNYDSITKADLIELLEGLIGRGTPVLTNRVHSLASGVYSFAVDNCLLEVNPFAGLKKRSPETPHDRVLDDAELVWFWPAVSSGPKSTSAGLALKLCLLLGLRAGEAAGLRRAEIIDIGDPVRAHLLIDGSRTKNGRSHLVPLPPMARQLVLEALESAGASNFLFPSQTNKAAPIGPHGLAWVMKRLAGEATLESWRNSSPSSHDLRRTCATRLAALKIPREDRLAVLNHTITDTHSKVYDKYERQDEKRQALETWDRALGRILDGDDGASVVVPLRRVQP